MLVASYIALHLGFGDSCSLILKLTVFHSLTGLPANFQDLPVSSTQALELQMNTRPSFYIWVLGIQTMVLLFSWQTLAWLRPQLSNSEINNCRQIDLGQV